MLHFLVNYGVHFWVSEIFDACIKSLIERRIDREAFSGEEKAEKQPTDMCYQQCVGWMECTIYMSCQ